MVERDALEALVATLAVAVRTCCPPVAVRPVSTARGQEQGGPL